MCNSNNNNNDDDNYHILEKSFMRCLLSPKYLDGISRVGEIYSIKNRTREVVVGTICIFLDNNKCKFQQIFFDLAMYQYGKSILWKLNFFFLISVKKICSEPPQGDRINGQWCS